MKIHSHTHKSKGNDREANAKTFKLPVKENY